MIIESLLISISMSMSDYFTIERAEGITYSSIAQTVFSSDASVGTQMQYLYTPGSFLAEYLDAVTRCEINYDVSVM